MAIDKLKTALARAMGIHQNDRDNMKTISDLRLVVEALGEEVIRLDEEVSKLKGK